MPSATTVLKKALARARVEQRRWTALVAAIETALDALRDPSGRVTIAKRGPMDAAERREVSRRMKRYWARRRSQNLRSPRRKF